VFGKLFRVSIFGESHGKCVSTLIERCPPGIDVNRDEIRRELERRWPLKGELTTSRLEEDDFEIISGIFNNKTTGAPICVLVWNKEAKPTEYEGIKDIPRPGHADYPAKIKYRGFNDYRGGGIFSGRLTAALVIAGYFAKEILRKYGIKVRAHVIQIGNIKLDREVSFEEIEKSNFRYGIECVDPKTASKMIDVIKKVKNEGDSIGGIIEGIAVNLPVGLGEPPDDTLDGDIAKALFMIPGVKGVEFGLGFKLACMTGSLANDQLSIDKSGKVVFLSNNMGGILGGMSNSMPIRVRVVFKPTPSIRKPQRSVDLSKKKEVILRLSGRFDPCIAIRAVPVVEAAMAIVLADHLLRWLSWKDLINSEER